MALPTNPATQWPPKELATSMGEIRRAAAWYTGNKSQLAEQALDQPDYAASTRRRFSFWSRSNTEIKRNLKMHIPLAADIAEASADLLFSETPIITFDDGETAAADRVEMLLAGTSFQSDLIEAAELSAGLGGGYWRCVWDKEAITEHSLIQFIQHDAAVPEFRFGRLVAVTFWEQLPGDSKDVWRHLERHETGSISHGLYCGTATTLGEPRPLLERAETAPLAEGLAEDGQSVDIELPGDVLTAGYIPNMRPNRVDRHSPLGRADIAGQYDELDALDEAWTSWMRDLRLGKSRILVPRGMLTDNGPGRGSSFDYDRELYEGLNMPPDSNTGLTMNQFQIRVDEHERTCRALVEQIISSSGYSLATFGLGDESAMTATEVNQRERRSMMTRVKKARYFAPELQRMIYTWLAVDKAAGFSDAEAVKPDIEIGDSVSEDPKVRAETIGLLAAAQAVSTQTKVRLAHPEWDDAKVDAEVMSILGEVGQAVTSPAGFDG